MASAQTVLIPSLPISPHLPESFPNPTHGTVQWQTLLSSPATATCGLIAGIASCDGNGGSLALHRHVQPEIYYALEGSGTVTVDGCEYILQEGGLLHIPGNAWHGVINRSERGFKWLYFFPGDGFSEVVYEFAGVRSGVKELDEAKRESKL